MKYTLNTKKSDVRYICDCTLYKYQNQELKVFCYRSDYYNLQ